MSNGFASYAYHLALLFLLAVLIFALRRKEG